MALADVAVHLGAQMYHDGWRVVSRALYPARYVLERLEYMRWIKKTLLTLLTIQFFTFLVAVVYYAAVISATFDEQGPIMNVVFCVISLATGGVFVLVTSVMSPPEWCCLIEDGRRRNVHKKFVLNVTLASVLALLTALTILEGSIVGFHPNFSFTTDDDTDVVGGVANQELSDGVALNGTFTLNDTSVLPSNFDGDVIAFDEYVDAQRDRTIGIYMFMACFAGVLTLVMRADVYLVKRRIVGMTIRNADLRAAQDGFDPRSHRRNNEEPLGALGTLLWMLTGGALVGGYAAAVAAQSKTSHNLAIVLSSVGTIALASVVAAHFLTRSLAV